jgi:hypothetical protein
VNRPPTIIVEEPAGGGGAVARPGLRIRARCEDDSGRECTLGLSAASGPLKNVGQWGDGGDRVDQELCLEQYSGQTLNFYLSAQDSDLRGSLSSIQVVVEPSQRLTEVLRTPGLLLDFDAERLLFLDAQRRAQVMDRATGQLTTIMESVPRNHPPCPSYCEDEPDRGSLASGGAWLFGGLSYYYAKESSVEKLSSFSSFSWSPSGSYLLVSTQGSFELRNLVTGTVTPVPGATTPTAVSDDGSVLYLSSGNLFRFRAGQTEQLTTDGMASSPWVTDGSRVVFNRRTGTTWQIVLLQEGQQIVLDDQRAQPAQAEWVLAHGWTAFTRPDSQASQVWLRSPEGQLTQISSGSEASFPLALGPGGQLIYRSGSQDYLGAPGSEPVPFAKKSNSRFKFLEGTPYVAMGNTLFQVDPSGPAEPLSCPVPPKKGGCAASGSGSWGVALLLVALSTLRGRRRSGTGPLSWGP